MNKTLKWITIALATTLIGATAGAPLKQYLFPTNGGIQTIGVNVTWLDGTPVTGFDWGIVQNNTAYVMEPINITNIENTNVTLTLSTANLSASIISLNLSWNYTGATLQPNQSVIVELTQTITATGDWSYTTVIEAKAI